MKRLLILLLALGLAGSAYSQLINPFVTINKIASQNGEFFLRTIPYDNVANTLDGLTIVYKKDSTELYRFDRYFDIRKNERDLFLSNDGSSIINIVNYEFKWRKDSVRAISLFRNGTLFKDYTLKEINACTDTIYDCPLLFSAIERAWFRNGIPDTVFKPGVGDFEKYIGQNTAFINHDTVFVFTNQSAITQIYMLSGDKKTLPFNAFNREKLSRYRSSTYIQKRLELPNFQKAEFFQSGQSIHKAIADLVGFSLYPGDENDLYKMIIIQIQVSSDRSGKSIAEITSNPGNFPEEKIRAYFVQNPVDTRFIPEGIDKWVSHLTIRLMDKDLDKSRADRKQEIAKKDKIFNDRLNLEIINGVYIPGNLEESFKELNKMLTSQQIDNIKMLKSSNEMTGHKHFPLSVWIQGNWGLTDGSRLLVYFKNRGLKFPVTMSEALLSYYYDWLKNRHEDWHKFDTGLFERPEMLAVVDDKLTTPRALVINPKNIESFDMISNEEAIKIYAGKTQDGAMIIKMSDNSHTLDISSITTFYKINSKYGNLDVCIDNYYIKDPDDIIAQPTEILRVEVVKANNQDGPKPYLNIITRKPIRRDIIFDYPFEYFLK